MTKQWFCENVEVIVWKGLNLESNDRLSSRLCDLTQTDLRNFLGQPWAISLENLSDVKLHLLKSQKPYAFIVAGGSFFESSQFFSDLKDAVQSLEPDTFIVGHLLDRKEKGILLHEQNFLLNVNIWKDIGSPDFIGQSSDGFRTAFVRSSENFHDDYTPYWVHPGKDSKNRIEKNSEFSAELIDRGLENNYKLQNFSELLRQNKYFVYPSMQKETLNRHFEEDQFTPSLWESNRKAARILSMTSLKDYSDKVYLWNTESLEGDFKGIQHKVRHLVCLASGFKPHFIIDRWGQDSCQKISYFDISSRAIEFRKSLSVHWDGEFIEPIFSRIYRDNFRFRGKVDSENLKASFEMMKKKFTRNQSFLEHWRFYQSLEKDFFHEDFLQMSENLFENIKTADTLWLSNLWIAYPNIWRFGLEGLRERFTSFLIKMNELNPDLRLIGTMPNGEVMGGLKVQEIAYRLTDGRMKQ